MLLDLPYIYLPLNLEGHLDLVYRWMMIFVQQLLMWVLLLFYACCKAVGFLTKLLWMYADNPCTKFLLWAASLLLGLLTVTYFCKVPNLGTFGTCPIVCWTLMMSFHMHGWSAPWSTYWCMMSHLVKLTYGHSYSVPRSALSKLAALYCSTWRFLWPMIGCLLQ